MEEVTMVPLNFHFALVEKFLASLQSRGKKALEDFCREHDYLDLDAENCTHTFYSWCLYSLKEFNPTQEKLAAIVANDKRLANFGLSGNLLEEQRLGHEAGELALYKSAVGAIETVWPGLYRLMAIIQPRVVRPVFENPEASNPESSSDIKVYGQIFFDMNRKLVSDWVEILSHEMGHQYLFAIYAAFHKKVQAPWSQKFHSAIRGEERPLIGLMHAVIAEAFMVYSALKIIESKDLEALHLGSKGVVARIGGKLVDDFDTINSFDLFAMDPELDVFISGVVAKTRKVWSPT